MRCLLTVLTILTSLSSIPAVPVAGPLSFPFRLKTELCLGASYLADLWLTSYHTGAGQSDLVLSRNRTAAPKWVITTDGALQRERGGGGGQNFDWSAQLAPSTGYAGWEPVTLHAGAKGSQGFAFEGDGQAPAVLTYSTTPGSDKATNGTEASGNQFYSWFGEKFKASKPNVEGWNADECPSSLRLEPRRSATLLARQGQYGIPAGPAHSVLRGGEAANQLRAGYEDQCQGRGDRK